MVILTVGMWEEIRVDDLGYEMLLLADVAKIYAPNLEAAGNPDTESSGVPTPQRPVTSPSTSRMITIPAEFMAEWQPILCCGCDG